MLKYYSINGVDINVERTASSKGLIFFNSGYFTSEDSRVMVDAFYIQYSCKIWEPKRTMYIYYNPDTNKYHELDLDYGSSHSKYGYYIGGVTFRYPINVEAVTYNDEVVTYANEVVDGPAYFKVPDTADCIMSVFIPDVLERFPEGTFSEIII